ERRTIDPSRRQLRLAARVLLGIDRCELCRRVARIREVDAMKNVAVLLAGGVGSRVGLDLPKQLIKIAGRPILEHTLAVLDRHHDVDEVLIMMAPGHLDAVREIVNSGGY